MSRETPWRAPWALALAGACVGAALVLGGGACTAALPSVDPTAFACLDDAPAADGELQCPASHWCAEGACAPRLGCFEADTSVPGCAENRRRCDLVTSLAISAATCVSGLHTNTSSGVRDLDACACGDGLHCVALAHVATASSPAAMPLYLFPASVRPARLPAASLGADGEQPRTRLCARVCSSELDCPAGQTCRATAVLEPATIAGTDQGRHTIGACFPDVLTTTSTLSDQPDLTRCRGRADCTTRLGRANGDCVARIDAIADHPARPSGGAWGEHLAIVPRCADDAVGIPEGIGCTEDGACRSGVCYQQRCVRLCDPSSRTSCGAAQDCLDTTVERAIGGGRSVPDRLFICR